MIRYKTVRETVSEAVFWPVRGAVDRDVDEAVFWAVDRAVSEAVDDAKNRHHPHLDEFIRELQEGGSR